ncbi:MAG: NAD(P)/FAD-dependent oxidoreductase [Bryobacterales bacterium]|nr:NAD(P)/FAD-dependent oxidoreductase [Bryobacterales bacterium]
MANAPQQQQQWAIAGGGMLGLTLALRLSRAGQHVTVFEAAPGLGGLASAWELDGATWDKFYHVILASDGHTRGLLRELQLEQDLEWRQTRTGFYSDRGLHPMSSSLDFLRFPLIGLVGKARLAATILYASRIPDWRPLEKVSVGEWLEKLSGRATYERIWLPLLRAKLGDRYRDTSAAFIWTTIARMYAARRSGLKREQFGYVRGGYARILSRLEQALAEAGVTVRRGAPVQAIESVAGGGVAVTHPGGTDRFDSCIVTAAAPVAARLCPGLLPDETARLEKIPYLGVICASVVLRKPLTGYYVTNIVDTSIQFTGVIEMTALVDPAELGGRHLVYLPKYVDPSDPLLDAPDAVIEARFKSELLRMYPDRLQPDDIAAVRIARARYVAALPTLNYSQLVPPVRTSIPGLYLVNSAQIVNGTLNVNETVHLADRAAATLLSGAGARERGGAEEKAA